MKMQHTTQRIALLGILLVLLVGCSAPAAAVQPATPDVSVIQTQAVQTAVFKMTVAAALNTTPTVPPTATNTPLPGATATATANATPTLVLPSPTLISTMANTPLPGGASAWIPTKTGHAPGDVAKLVSSYPADLAVYRPGEQFDATFTFTNIGTTTWKKEYYLRFARGESMTKADHYYLPKTVAPGESVTITVDVVSPGTAGIHTAYFELCNDNAALLYQVYLSIKVK